MCVAHTLSSGIHASVAAILAYFGDAKGHGYKVTPLFPLPHISGKHPPMTSRHLPRSSQKQIATLFHGKLRIFYFQARQGARRRWAVAKIGFRGGLQRPDVVCSHGRAAHVEGEASTSRWSVRVAVAIRCYPLKTSFNWQSR